MAGATVQWLRDGLQIIDKASDIEALAASVPNTGDVYLVPAFCGFGCARLGRAGQRFADRHDTRYHARAHCPSGFRSHLPGKWPMCFQAMAKDSGMALTELRVDGGASQNNLLMQLQADALGVPVVRSKITETTALGAAYLAGLATGFWTSAHQITSQWAQDRRF